MPTVIKQEEVVYSLELSTEEAAWLRALTQNPLCDDEPLDYRHMRQSFFVALANAGVPFP